MLPPFPPLFLQSDKRGGGGDCPSSNPTSRFNLAALLKSATVSLRERRGGGGGGGGTSVCSLALPSSPFPFHALQSRIVKKEEGGIEIEGGGANKTEG